MGVSGKKLYTILCLGESTTFFGGRYSWPAQLQDILNTRGKNLNVVFRTINKGVSGCNSTFILSRLEAHLDEYRPDLVAVMMGINDGRGAVTFIPSQGKSIASFLLNLKIVKLARLIRLRILKLRELARIKSFIQGEAGKKDDSPRAPPTPVFKKDDKGERECAETAAALEEKIKQAPSDVEALRELGRSYNSLSRYQEAVPPLERAAALAPSDVEALRELGISYNRLGRYQEAVPPLERAAALAPSDAHVAQELGFCYNRLERYAEGAAVLERAMSLAPSDAVILRELSWSYAYQHRFPEAKALLRKAMELDSSYLNYVYLGVVYNEAKEYKSAEIMFKKALESNPFSSNAALGLEHARIWQRKAGENQDMYAHYIENYRMLKEKIVKRGLRVVCIQYPMCSVGPLKNIFAGQAEGVIFVDNERIFKDAVNAEGYEAYFTDKFADVFGHCTEKGNRLLAENIARAVLREVFSLE